MYLRVLGWVGLSLSAHLAVGFASAPAGWAGSGGGWLAPNLNVVLAPDARSADLVSSQFAEQTPRLVDAAPLGGGLNPKIGSGPAFAAGSMEGDPLWAADFDSSAFVPSKSLTQRPHPLGHIAVAYPEATVRGVASMSLTLYVDEAGRVVNIELDDGRLPVPFQRAAWAAFANARFEPGRMHDEPVKTRMQVEVFFEDRPSA